MSKGQDVRGRMNAAGACGRAALILAVVMVASACSERTIDTGLVGAVFGGGPPPDAPSPVRGMSGTQATYPNLATVPGRPSDIPPLAQREKDISTLEQDRGQARSTAKALEDRYKPLPVPPKPKVEAGKAG